MTMRQRLDSVQYMRGLAAMMIVLFHVNPRLTRAGSVGEWPSWLNCGVDIFFIISGFIMWVTTAEKSVGPLEFFRRRLVRIIPLYWLVTGVAVTVLILAPSLMQGGRFDLAHVVASYLFIPWRHPQLGTIDPVVPQGWTLNYEIIFYLIFGACLILRRSLRAIVTSAALLVLFGAALTLAPGHDAATFYASSIMLEFALGMAVGIAYLTDARVPIWAAVLLFVAGAAGIAVSSTVTAGWPRLLGCGVPAAAMVAGAVFFERAVRPRRWMIPGMVGDASYSIYLIHGFVLSAVAVPWARFDLFQSRSGMLGFTVVGVSASALAGIALYKMVELPIIRLCSGSRPLPIPPKVDALSRG